VNKYRVNSVKSPTSPEMWMHTTWSKTSPAVHIFS